MGADGGTGRGRGQPRKLPADAVSVRVRLAPAEAEAVRRAAAELGYRSANDFLRRLLAAAGADPARAQTFLRRALTE